MKFLIKARVIIRDGSELDGQHGEVFALGGDGNPFASEDERFCQIAVDGMRGAPVKVKISELQEEEVK